MAPPQGGRRIFGTFTGKYLSRNHANINIKDLNIISAGVPKIAGDNLSGARVIARSAAKTQSYEKEVMLIG
jgi:hypothetical protein